MSCTEQVLVATPHKTAAIQPPTIHLENYQRRTRYAGHCWRSGDVLQSTPSHGRAKAGQPARTYIQQLWADTGCSLEDLSGAKDDRDGWQERVRKICAGSATWWWWRLVHMCRGLQQRSKQVQTLVALLSLLSDFGKVWTPHLICNELSTTTIVRLLQSLWH